MLWDWGGGGEGRFWIISYNTFVSCKNEIIVKLLKFGNPLFRFDNDES